MQPLILDLFCGAGGAAVGYQRVGFDLVGVDHEPQPRYPFPFLQADALGVLADLAAGRAVGPFLPTGRRYSLHDFAAVHASPPCQAYCALRSLHLGREYPDLVAPVRAVLMALGRPYAVENVPGAPLVHPRVLCGGMFPGLRVYRHRLFECSFWCSQPPHPRHVARAGAPGTKGGRGRKAHYLAGGHVTVAGNVGRYAGEAMGIDWMTGAELSQAVPPAYTHYLGLQLLRALEEGVGL